MYKVIALRRARGWGLSLLLLWLLTLVVMPSLAGAQSVIRGPYLQKANSTSMLVRWRTDVATDSAVRFGVSAANLNQIVSTANSVTDHEVTLTGLDPNTAYYYSVGTVAVPLAGDSSYVLTTSPVPGQAKPTRVWVLGDSGTANANAAAVRDAYTGFNGTRDTDLVLMLGDNAYNIGNDAEYQAAVFDMYPEQLRKASWWPALGNHDAIDVFFNPPGVYFDLVSMPAAAESGGMPSGSELYYAFDYGDIHFVCLDSQLSDRSVDGPMLTWLEADLVANDKFWTVVYWHHPPYSKGSHDSDTEVPMVQMRENVVPILESYGVDLVLAGHSHSYERSFLLNGHHDVSTTLTAEMLLDDGDGREGGDGAYSKAGAAGTPDQGAVYVTAGSSGKTEAAPLDHPVMFSSLLTLGSVVLDVSGNRLEFSFLDSAGNVRDYFTLVKSTDTFAPGLVDATANSYYRLDVLFAESVDPISANNIANYSIAGVTVTDAVLQPDERTVRLMLGEFLDPASVNTVVANNVTDISNNPVGIFNQRKFTAPDPVPGDVDGDGNFDWWDVGNTLGLWGQPARGPDDPADINGDGIITIDDSWLVRALCELPRCAIINNP